jgi:DNA-binding LacI/PurR family transcriptional regulator
LGDEYIDDFAKKNGVDTTFFPTDWKRYGKEALKERAISVLSDCDGIIAFKTKKDTELLLKMAEEKNIPIRRVT